MKRRRWTPAEKAAILARYLGDREPAARICADTGVSPSLLSAWAKHLLEHAAELFDRSRDEASRLRAELDGRHRLVRRLRDEVAVLCVEVLRLKKPNGGRSAACAASPR